MRCVADGIRASESGGAAGIGHIALVVGVVWILGACSPGDTGQPTEPDAETVPDLEAIEPSDEPAWRVTTVDTGDVGEFVDIEFGPDGEPGVVYFASQPRDGGLCEALGEDAPNREVWPLSYATRVGKDWRVENLLEPAYVQGPKALDLAYRNGDGTATVATMDGEPLDELGYCGAHDLVWMSRQGEGDWSLETAVRTSGEAEVGDEVSDFGEVVGPWASLAYGQNGEPWIAYRDIHQGGRQMVDTTRADLEIARRSGGGWSAQAIDWGRGAGKGVQLGVDEEGRLVVAYLIPSESQQGDQLGLWVARSSDGGDSWTKLRLTARPTPSPPAMLVGQGAIHVLSYNTERGYPQLWSLSEPERFGEPEAWSSSDIGVSSFDEGLEPALARGPSGRLMAAYRRCGRAASGLGNCRREDDAVVFARRMDGDWEHEVVDTGDETFCGQSLSMAVDEGGDPVVAYRCNERGGGEVTAALRVASPEEE